MLMNLLRRLRLHKLFSKLLKRRRVKHSLLSRLNRLRKSALSWFEDLESKFTTRFQRAIRRPIRRSVLIGMETLEDRQLLATGTVTSISASALSLSAGQSEVLTATISSLTGSATAIDSGTVQFYDNGTALGAPQTVTQASGSPNGTASLTTASLGTGTHVLTAQYSGNSTFSASSSSTYPTFDGSTNYINLPSTGLSDFTTGFSYTIWAKPTSTNQYGEFFDIGNGPSTNEIQSGYKNTTFAFYEVNGGTTLNTGAANKMFAYSWHNYAITWDTSKKITLYVDGSSVATYTNIPLPDNVTRTIAYVGKSEFSDNPLYVGQMHDLQFYNTALTAAQVSSIYSSGTATTPNFNPPVAVASNVVSTAMTSSATVTVNKATSTTTLATSAAATTFGDSVTFTATVTSGATGTVTFKDGNTTLGTGSITNGTATYTTTALTGGGHSITAVYAGDSNYQTSTSSALSQAVLTTFVVTTTSDTGSGSLRWAVGLANSDPAADTIIFDSTVFANLQTITLGGSQIELSDTAGATTITGPAAGVTISGNNTSRVFQIDANVTATLSGMTITGGNITNGSGGGIYNLGTVTLNNCTISGNSSDTGGGGMDSRGGGTATLTNCTISGNSAYNGGGLDSHGDTSTLTLTNSTISGNSANNAAGGLLTDGTASLTNCTISGNSAQTGGGVFNNGGTATLTNTIVAGNTASTGPDTFNSFNSLGNNLIGQTDDSSGWGSSDKKGSTASPLNAMLAPLGNNGGPTQTMALLPGSPAIAAGTSTGAPTTDQRGYTRNGAIDIGAYQYVPTVGTLASTTTLTTSAANSSYNTSVTFTATVTNGATGTVTFKDGTTTLGTGTVSNGTATYTTSTLTIGSHSISAVYGGDGNYLASTGYLGSKLTPINAGFESPDLGSDFWAFSYRTNNASWGFTGYAGLVVNNGGWGVAGAGTTNPDGTKSALGQAALIQFYPGET